MGEAGWFLLTLAAALLLVLPLARRLPVPGWYARARQRGRPGVPVVSVLGALLLMALAWWIGERRGWFGAVLQLVWIGAPLLAVLINLDWRRTRRAARRIPH